MRRSRGDEESCHIRGEFARTAIRLTKAGSADKGFGASISLTTKVRGKIYSREDRSQLRIFVTDGCSGKNQTNGKEA